MELLKDAPINNLFEGDKPKIIKIFDNAKESRLTTNDISELFRITQQNCGVFSTFQISLILRIAESLYRGDSLQESSDYIHSNISGAYGFYY